MKKMLIFLIVIALLFPVLTPLVNPATNLAEAGIWCDIAALSGYRHPGASLACAYELLMDWWLGNDMEPSSGWGWFG